MKRSRAQAFAYALALVITALTMVACEEEGPAEKLGEKLDEAVKDATD